MNYHGWSLLELYPALLWPIGVIFILALVCFIALRPLRKRGNKTAKYLTFVLPIIGWAIWHFFPSFTFKGTYQGEIQTHIDSEPISFKITIDESSFCAGPAGQEAMQYELDPFLRVLWLPDHWASGLDDKERAAKLGWNTITHGYFKIGPVKHYKQKKGEPVN
jgi:hypothetical protein